MQSDRGESVTGDAWSTLPFLARKPHFHLDPVEGGAPVLSADGRWWWDGSAWTPVKAEQPAPA